MTIISANNIPWYKRQIVICPDCTSVARLEISDCQWAAFGRDSQIKTLTCPVCDTPLAVAEGKGENAQVRSPKTLTFGNPVLP